MEKINVGLIGFGTVGTGVVKVLQKSGALISERLGAEIVLKRVADHDTTTDRGVTLPDGVLVSDASVIIDDPEIDIVVELIGGTGAAKELTLQAIEKGKHIATANKALLSTHGKEIFSLAADKGVEVGFEASVGGGIPVLKALREGLAANHIDSMYGIINGTANYILSKMKNEGGKFEDVLKLAQEMGYAEADPTYDVDGIDTAHKLALLINIAYGTYITHEDVYTEGIRSINQLDIDFASEFGLTIKLLAIAKSIDGKVEARVHPTMIPSEHPLATVDGAYNAVFMHGDAVGSVMFYGLGAGMEPTASAVVADIIDICRDIKSGGVGRTAPLSTLPAAIKEVELKATEELDIQYYMRFLVTDSPGVLASISGVLGAHNISIYSVIQHERKVGGAVALVIRTHHAMERELRAAVAEIEELEVTKEKVVYIRIEETLGASE
ncbi:MAG: homoserine dehydrogenase [Proteobacteria bacterium]|nr:homoserine dehydrogenase [Pseudomonadota bacterium]